MQHQAVLFLHGPEIKGASDATPSRKRQEEAAHSNPNWIERPHTEIPTETVSWQWRISASSNYASPLFEKWLVAVWSGAMIWTHSNRTERSRIMPSAINRTAASQALAKAIAYHQAGKVAMAKEWPQRLIAMLRDAGIDVS